MPTAVLVSSPPTLQAIAPRDVETSEEVKRILWNRTDLYRALDLGLFSSDIKMELIEGELIAKMPQKNAHITAIMKAQNVLPIAFGTGYHVRSQCPLPIDEMSEPEPDMMIVVGSLDDYQDHPSPPNVKLVLEVSDTTLHYDRTTKAALYARAGIEDYWVLVLKNRTLEVRRVPTKRTKHYGYKSLTTYTETDTVTPLHAPQAAIRVADLLPKL